MKTLLLGLCLWFLAPAGHTTEAQAFSAFFDTYVAAHAPWMTMEHRREVKFAIWVGCQGDFADAKAFTKMCGRESSFKVRKWNDEAPNRTDLAGTHYGLLFAMLNADGFTKAKWHDYTKNKECLRWKAIMAADPAFGTSLAAQAFHGMSKKMGMRCAIQRWKWGKVGEVPALLYLNAVLAG